MNFSVFLLLDGESVPMLKGSSLDSAIAFASYLFVNTKRDYEVRNQADVCVVRYIAIS